MAEERKREKRKKNIGKKREKKNSHFLEAAGHTKIRKKVNTKRA